MPLDQQYSPRYLEWQSRRHVERFLVTGRWGNPQLRVALWAEEPGSGTEDGYDHQANQKAPPATANKDSELATCNDPYDGSVSEGLMGVVAMI